MTHLIRVIDRINILILISNVQQPHLHVFNILVQCIHITVDFIVGDGASSFHNNVTIHNDFYVDTTLILTIYKITYDHL